jgi:hypothetical protein
MSDRLSHLNRRLVKVEQQVAHIARREQLAGIFHALSTGSAVLESY